MKLFLNLLFIVLTSFLINKYLSHTSNSNTSVYQKVMSTNKLRCGYGLWPSYIDRDPNTGKLSGAYYEIVNEMAKSLEIQVEWTEEVAFGDISSALNSNRIDAFCAGAWTNTPRGKVVEFTIPASYSSVIPYARAEDDRFKSIEDINNENVVISVIDGESSQVIAESDFPKAKRLVMPKNSESSQNILNLITKKSDVIMGDPTMINAYEKNNPGKIKKINSKFPLRIFGNTICVKKDEMALKSMLDNALSQLIWTGKIEKIIRKYEQNPGDFIRVKLPFEE